MSAAACGRGVAAGPSRSVTQRHAASRSRAKAATPLAITRDISSSSAAPPSLLRQRRPRLASDSGGMRPQLRAGAGRGTGEGPEGEGSGLAVVEAEDDVEAVGGPAQRRGAPQQAPQATVAGSSEMMLMGMPASPELLAISMVYFVQGILGLSRLAVTYFMKDDLHLEPATVTLLAGIGSFPWLVKPLYGLLSDTVPLGGYKRRSYLFACGLLSSAGWAYMAAAADSAPGLVMALVAGNLGSACSDVVVDSIVVERARGQPQSLCWGSAAVGGILSAYFSGSLVETYGTRWVFGATALFPLIVSSSALLISEEKVIAKKGTEAAAGLGKALAGFVDQTKPVIQAFKQRQILLPALFCFVWQATPSAGSAMFFYQTNYLHFTPEFLGRVQLVGSIASLGGVTLYKTLLKDVPLRKIFFWTSVLSGGFALTDLILITGLNRQIGLDDHLFVLGDSLLLTVLGQISFMPILVLATRVCPEGVEATLYATLMSVLNGGSFTGQALGAALTKAMGVTSDDFTNLAPLVTICAVSCLAPLPFLSLLPSVADQTDEEGKGAEDD